MLLMLGKVLFNLRLNCFRVVIVSKPKFQTQLESKSNTFFRKQKLAKETHTSVFGPFDLSRFLLLKRNNKTMEYLDTQEVKPPVVVRGMTKLDKSKFDRIFKIPVITIPVKILRTISKQLKPYQLKLTCFAPIVGLEKTDPKFSSHKQFLMDPHLIRSFDALPDKIKKTLANENVSESDFQIADLKSTYNNWNFQEVIQAIMPDDIQGVTGFTEIGHIAHFNLKNAALPFKHIIGEVLLDKRPTLKTVVNKLNTIDNTYRTFLMELLAGEDNFVTQTKEYGVTFELDFSKVYWNSRLDSEHHMIVKDLSSTDIVFDVFAGIGPFAVPAAKKRATVFANDLNPFSHEYLLKNIALNKCDSSLIECSNLDGREFIQTVLKKEMISIYSGEMTYKGMRVDNITSISILMNLPALAFTFLDAFNGLLIEMDTFNLKVPLATVHCYCFTDITESDETWNGDMNKELVHRVIGVIGGLSEDEISLRAVRDVAPQKLMMCVSFKLTPELLCSSRKLEGSHSSRKVEGNLGSRKVEESLDKDVAMTDEPPIKCLKLETNV